ncbi:PDZ domain-containing protein [Tautonia sp. JC769]|uniref:M61 family metallopeptidase n=1 Tax=Tautonia sp. JC769 TaxID=3232135 RepID=UPI00345A09D9
MPKSTTADDSPTPVRYALRFPEAGTHYVEVEAEVPTDGRPALELFMATWTPGSYLIREFSRHVEAVSARDPEGTPLPVRKVRKNRWRVESSGHDRVIVSYRVYGREMGVQTNWIDASFALINGAPTFLTPADSPPRPHEVSLELHPDWSRSITGLPDAPGGTPHRYVAENYDILVDSPIYAGNPDVYEFEVDGIPHLLVNEGEAGIWDGPRSARDVETIVRTQRDFWGSLPYDRYVFFNLLTGSGGGLEHRNSTVLMSSRWATRSRASYLNWLYLVSHEYFHTWNVKRLRPVELGPFDYENEVHTRSLWVAEGITSYYDRLFVRRAGLCSVKELLAGDPPRAGSGDDRPKNDIQRLHENPGRLVHRLEESSFDAWIKLYRRDENSANTSISYYTKGAVVAFLLDAEIRRATDDARSLDDVMRLTFERYAGDVGFSSEQFLAVVAEVAGVDLAPWFERALRSTEELDYGPALDWLGLRFAPIEGPKAPEDGSTADPEKGWIGLDTKIDGGRLVVSAVKRETPGFDAGFNVGDEILAIGELRVPPDGFKKRVGQYPPGETVSVLIARREQLMRLDAILAAEPPDRFRIEADPDATDEQVARRSRWLGD